MVVTGHLSSIVKRFRKLSMMGLRIGWNPSAECDRLSASGSVLLAKTKMATNANLTSSDERAGSRFSLHKAASSEASLQSRSSCRQDARTPSITLKPMGACVAMILVKAKPAALNSARNSASVRSGPPRRSSAQSSSPLSSATAPPLLIRLYEQARQVRTSLTNQGLTDPRSLSKGKTGLPFYQPVLRYSPRRLSR